jgi:hypothetical protein
MDKHRFAAQRVAGRRGKLVAVLAALVAALSAGATAGATDIKPAPSLEPVPGSREPISPGAGTVNGLPVPDVGGRPEVLSAQRQHQLIASAVEAAAKGPMPAPPAAPPLEPGGTVVGSPPPVKVGSTHAQPTRIGPLLIPPPSAASGASAASSINTIYGSTQVDNRGGCGDWGANESSVAQSSVNPNNVVVVFQMYRNPDGTCGDSHDFIAYSRDGGHHWLQRNPAVLTSPVSGDAVVTYDARHNLFVHAFLEFSRTSGLVGRVAAEVSGDGSSWSRDVTLASNSSTHSVDKPMITADNNPASPHFGRVVVTWTDFQSLGDLFFDAYTDDGGLTWHFGSSSINFTGECGNGTSPAFDASGGLMVAWWECTGGTAKLREEYSPDGGATWPGSDILIANIDSIENPVSGACFLNGGGSQFRCNSFPSLVGSPNVGGVGNTAFAVVWSDVDSITQSGVTHNVAEIHGLSTVNPTTGGATWNFGFFGSFANFGDKFFPWASFSVTDGRLNIGYLSRENDASTANPQGFRFNQHETEAGSLCRLRGGCGGDQFISYTVDGTLSNPGTSLFIGDYDGSSSYDRNFDSFPSWTDIRNGVNDVRTAQLCYLDCYGFLSPNAPVLRGFVTGSTFTDFWEINTDPLFGGSGNNFWNAVGIREGADGTAIDDDTFVSPNRYYDSILASSAFGRPYNDYLLINNNTGAAPNAAYYPQVHSFSTVGGAYTVEWAYGHLVLGTSLAGSMAAGNVVRVYDSFLNTGTTYYFGLRPVGGNTSIYTFALHSASGGAYQGAPGAAAVMHRTPAGQPSFLSFATGAQPSQWDGLVVQNDNGGSGSYTLYRDTAAPTGTIAINGGAVATNNVNVTLNLTGSNPTPGDPVSDMRFSTDAVNFSAWQPFALTAPFTLPAGDGTKTVFVQFRNGAGAVSATMSDSIILDTVAPSAPGVPGKTFSLNTTLPLSATGPIPVTILWTAATDSLSGIRSYELDQSVNGGAWTIAIMTTSLGVVRQLTPAALYQFRVRAFDRAGNAGPFTYGTAFHTAGFQDSAPKVTYSTSPAWTTLTDATKYYGGTEKQATALTAQANLAVPLGWQRIGWVSAKGPNYGIATVYLDGVAVATVDLYATTVQLRKTVAAIAVTPGSSHTIRVRTTSKNAASTGYLDAVDAFTVIY